MSVATAAPTMEVAQDLLGLKAWFLTAEFESEPGARDLACLPGEALLIEERVTLMRKLDAAPRVNAEARPRKRVSVCVKRPQGNAERLAILKIAASSFQRSRFFVDRRIPFEGANAVKLKWAESLASGQRGEYLRVALWNSEVVGFVGLRSCSDVDPSGPGFRIDLLGVHETTRGKGVASALLHDAIRFSTEQERDLVTGTQSSNHAALSLYRSAGFEEFRRSWIVHAMPPQR
jgi:ribosomal protein S18 acetylase RimI-like enzyme